MIKRWRDKRDFENTDISLGQKYRDKLTDFEGYATGLTLYLSGCFHVRLERMGNDGKVEADWFDELRLEPVRARAYADSGPVRSPGAPAPNLPRPSHM
jgi:hypothetical protein